MKAFSTIYFLFWMELRCRSKIQVNARLLVDIIINTKNILFVGAGAFSKTKVTDLAVELQGRLPVSVKMDKLTQEVREVYNHRISN